MRQLTTANIQWNFTDNGEGEVLLLIHGFPLDHRMWKYQIQSMSEFYRVICPDLPGFGSFCSSENPITMRQLADDLVLLLDTLEIPTVSFCGLSMGGYIGWQFWKYHAQRLDRLIACDTRTGADNDATARGRRMSAQAARENGIGNLADDMIPKLFAAGNLVQRPEDVVLIREMISATKPETVAQAQLAMATRPDATDWFASNEIPMLFIVGEYDSITSPQEMRENCAAVARARMVEISNAGHLSPLENPAEFNQAVLEFLQAT